MLIGEHDLAVADLQLGVADAAVRLRHAHDFFRAEGLLVELDRVARALDAQVGRDRVVAVGNRLGLSCHDCTSSSAFSQRRRQSKRRLRKWYGVSIGVPLTVRRSTQRTIVSVSTCPIGQVTSSRCTSSTVSTGRSPMATTRSPTCNPARAAGASGSTLTISIARAFGTPTARASLRSSGRDWPPKPRYARETRPRARSCGITHVAVSIGTAKLMPWAIAKTAELIPTTRPRESTSG